MVTHVDFWLESGKELKAIFYIFYLVNNNVTGIRKGIESWTAILCRRALWPLYLESGKELKDERALDRLLHTDKLLESGKELKVLLGVSGVHGRLIALESGKELKEVYDVEAKKYRDLFSWNPERNWKTNAGPRCATRLRYPGIRKGIERVVKYRYSEPPFVGWNPERNWKVSLPEY